MSPAKMFVLLTTFAAAVLTRSQAAAVPKTTPGAVLSTTQQPMGPFWGIWKRDLNAITSIIELQTLASATADSVQKRDALGTIGTSVPFRTFVTRDVEKREVASSTVPTVEDFIRATAGLSAAPGISLVPREADEEDDEAATKTSSGKSSNKEVSERDDEDASEAQSSTCKASTSMVPLSTVMATVLGQGAVTRGDVAESSTAPFVATASESASLKPAKVTSP